MPTLIEDMDSAGPVRGVRLLFERTRTGAVSADEFTAGLQHLVFRVLQGIEDMEDFDAMSEQLASMPVSSLPTC